MALTKARGWILVGVSLAVMAAVSPPHRAVAGAGQMLTGGLTSQPIGHYDFCRRHPHECSIRTRDHGPLRMTEDMRTLLATVNVTVNKKIRPMNDRDIYGREEFWAFPDQGVGDCEDYVLLKRKYLHESGIALSNLLITVVRKPDGEGHAVLTVRSDKGDLILDNLNQSVKRWEDTGYKFLKRQATNHSGRWVAIRNEHTVLVGSVDDK